MLCFMDEGGPWSYQTVDTHPSEWICEDHSTVTLAQLNAKGWSVTGFTQIGTGGSDRPAIIVSR